MGFSCGFRPGLAELGEAYMARWTLCRPVSKGVTPNGWSTRKSETSWTTCREAVWSGSSSIVSGQSG